MITGTSKTFIQLDGIYNMKSIPQSGTEYANRLLKNIKTSLTLRKSIAPLDILLKQKPIASTRDFNSSSNFLDLDSALREVLSILSTDDDRILQAPDIRPLPLQEIYDNLSSNLNLLSELLEDYRSGKEAAIILYNPTATLIMLRLDLINLSAV
jgi:hypothetical protein